MNDTLVLLDVIQLAMISISAGLGVISILRQRSNGFSMINLRSAVEDIGKRVDQLEDAAALRRTEADTTGVDNRDDEENLGRTTNLQRYAEERKAYSDTVASSVAPLFSRSRLDGE